jgi:Gpi18-like mannosyltransferase
MEGFLLLWYDKLAAGGFAALREPFSDYTPPYLYLLFFVTKTAGFLPKIVGIKLLSILFDFLNTFWIYKILRIKFPKGAAPWIGASVFLVLPTVILNSAYWGQCDSIYAFFLLACIFFLMKEQSLLAMTALGISFAIKAQAFFFAPFILC